MKIAILGATSQIARDLIFSFSAVVDTHLHLFARRPEIVSQWLASVGLADRYAVGDFLAFSTDECFDAIFNFVGAGNPVLVEAMGASIFEVTLHYDELALGYLRQHPQCRYIFLSSGAAYGSSFEHPVDQHSSALVAINNLQPQDWYAAAKLHAECRHRSLPHMSIVDIRVFNYFSRTQDISARFLITDILRAIRDRTVLKTSPAYVVRDYLHPTDFFQLVSAILFAPTTNMAVDCYSRAPIDKPTLLMAMQEKFGLLHESSEDAVSIDATGIKPHYYSLNRRAANFGYQPTFNSLEGVLEGSEKILASISV